MGVKFKNRKYCHLLTATLVGAAILLPSSLWPQLPSHSVSWADARATTLPEISFTGYEEGRVRNLFVNPSDFASPFTSQADYNPQKFSIGYVTPTNQFNNDAINPNDRVAENTLSTWFKVNAQEKSLHLNAQITANGQRASTINAQALNKQSGHGFEYYQTDIISGTNKTNHGIATLDLCPGTTHQTQYISGVKNAHGTTDNDYLIKMDKPNSYDNLIVRFSKSEIFTLKLGASYNYSLINSSELPDLDTNIWFSSLYWNYGGTLDNTNFQALTLPDDNSITRWNNQVAETHNQGMVVSFMLDPASQEIGLFSGTTAIQDPAINPAVVEKLKTMHPSEAVDAMMMGGFPLFEQHNQQAFPGTIYGDSQYTLIPDDTNGCLTLKYTPGALLEGGEVKDNHQEYTYHFYGFALSQLPTMNNPDSDSIDLHNNVINNTHNIIDVFQKPSMVTPSQMNNFIYQSLLAKIVQAPDDFRVEDLEVSYIPFDYEGRILVNRLTLKRILVSTGASTSQVFDLDLSVETNFYVYGFQTKPVTPDAVDPSTYATQIWMDGSPYQMIPQVLIEHLQQQDNQLINTNMVAAIKRMLSTTGEYFWNDGHSSFVITNIVEQTNAAQISGKSAQVIANVTLNNLLNAQGKTVSLDTQVYLFHATPIEDAHTAALPTDWDVKELDADFKTFTKDEFLTKGSMLFQSYLTQLLNRPRLNTVIPYAYLTNIVLEDVGENAVDANFDVVNYLPPNVGDANPNYLLSTITKQTIHLTNFYQIPVIDDDAVAHTTQFQLTPAEFEITSLSAFAESFPTDLLHNTTVKKILIDNLFQDRTIMETWYQNLPDDYFTVNSHPIIFDDSFVADDREGTLRFSYSLTYALINGEKVSNPHGTILYNTITLKGFKNSKSLPLFPKISTVVNEAFAASEATTHLQTTFLAWINDVLASDHLSEYYKQQLKTLLQNKNYTISATLMNYDKKTNIADFLVTIPEVSMVVPILGDAFLTGFNHQLKYENAYQPNAVTIEKDGYIDMTYDEFASNLSKVQVTDLLSIKGALPFNPTGTAPSIAKVNPYYAASHSAVIEFLFPVFYGPDTLIYNHLLSFTFTFASDDPLSGQRNFVEELSLSAINTATFANPFKDYTTAEIVHAYANDDFYRKQIETWLNTPQLATILFQHPPKVIPPLRCANLIYQNPTSLVLGIVAPNGIIEPVTISGLSVATASVTTVLSTLPNNVTYENVTNLFVAGDALQNNAVAQQFINTAPLPVDATITNAYTHSVGYDKAQQKVAYLNFVYNKYFMETKIAGGSVQVFTNVVVQVKLTFDENNRLSQQAIAQVFVGNPSIHQPSSSFSIILLVVLGFAMGVMIGFLIWFIMTKKHSCQGGRL